MTRFHDDAPCQVGAQDYIEGNTLRGFRKILNKYPGAGGRWPRSFLLDRLPYSIQLALKLRF